MPIPPCPEGVYEIQSGPWRAWFTPFGARMIQLWHYKRPLMLGLTNPEDYKKDPASLGAICGRYGNRIAGGQLSRDGRHWQLDQNEGEQCLHGGRQGFGVQAWQVAEHASDRLVLMIDSPDLDMGFPGRCQARVSFQLSPDAVNVQISAAVDQACPLNLIQHNYWNLGCDAANHRLVLMADQYWENNERNLPESLNDVSDETDFRAAKPIRTSQIDRTYQVPGSGMRLHAQLMGPYGQLAVHSDQPSIQLYCAAHLYPIGPALGAVHNAGAAVCLETQQLPNGPQLDPQVWIEPGRDYLHQIRWEFTPA